MVARVRRDDQAAGVPSPTLHHDLADELWEADRTAKPIAPLTDRHPDLVLEDAYAIQTINIDRRIAAGQRIIGRKVGLTSRPMQQMLGVDEPDFGVLTDAMFVEDGDLIDLDRLVQPRVEAELAFVMEHDLAGPGVTTPAPAPRSPASFPRWRSWTAGSPTGRSSWSTPWPTTPPPAYW